MMSATQGERLAALETRVVNLETSDTRIEGLVKSLTLAIENGFSNLKDEIKRDYVPMANWKWAEWMLKGMSAGIGAEALHIALTHWAG